jgi:hypothetical protein
MDQTKNLREAIHRFHVLYGSFPEKAIVPEKDYDDTVEGVNPLNISYSDRHFVMHVSTHHGSGYVKVTPGKTSAVSLFHRQKK